MSDTTGLPAWLFQSRRLIPEARDLTIHYGLRLLPTETCSLAGRWLGNALGRRGHPAAEARARIVLSRLRPDFAAPEAIEGAQTRLWANIGRTYAEFSVIHRMLRDGWSTLSDPTLLDAAYADDRPLILCFVHLGNWEVLGRQVATHPRIHRGRRITAVVMPPANRAHAFIAARRRGMLPADLVPMGPRVWHAITEKLRQPGGIVWIAADDVAKGRVYAPHFGRVLRTDGNLGKIVRLAATTGARVLPIYNERLYGARSISHVLAPVEIPRGRLTDDVAREQVARIDAVFDPIVRRLVDQWYMATEFDHDPYEPIA